MYIDLLLSFSKVGICTFGGGYTMLPLLEKEVVEKRQWCNHEELLEYFAIGQMTPGIIAVNTATFIGYQQKGILGAIVATLGMILPSVLIILTIAFFFEPFFDLPLFQHAFKGVEIGVLIILTQAIYKLAKSTIKTNFSVYACLIVLVAQLFFNFAIITMIALTILVGSIDYIVRIHQWKS